MKPEELKSLVGFKREKLENGSVVITGSVTFTGQYQLDPNEAHGSPDLENAIKERIKEMMVRRIYEDRSAELIEAVMDLRACDPFRIYEQCQRILTIARHQ